MKSIKCVLTRLLLFRRSLFFFLSYCKIDKSLWFWLFLICSSFSIWLFGIIIIYSSLERPPETNQLIDVFFFASNLQHALTKCAQKLQTMCEKMLLECWLHRRRRDDVNENSFYSFKNSFQYKNQSMNDIKYESLHRMVRRKWNIQLLSIDNNLCLCQYFPNIYATFEKTNSLTFSRTKQFENDIPTWSGNKTSNKLYDRQRTMTEKERKRTRTVS